jgi:predicted Zn-dependent protease
MAETYIKKGDVEKGIKLLEAFIKKSGKSAFLLYECLAFAYYDTGQLLKARAAALTAIKEASQGRDTGNYEIRFKQIIRGKGS